MLVPVLRLPRAVQEPQIGGTGAAHGATPAVALGEGVREFMTRLTELTIARAHRPALRNCKLEPRF